MQTHRRLWVTIFRINTCKSTILRIVKASSEVVETTVRVERFPDIPERIYGGSSMRQFLPKRRIIVGIGYQSRPIGQSSNRTLTILGRIADF
jgi:hypothetical protein